MGFDANLLRLVLRSNYVEADPWLLSAKLTGKDIAIHWRQFYRSEMMFDYAFELKEEASIGF